MRYERLVIEGGGASYALDFHPRLTVVTGVGQIERDGIINEMVGALGTTRAGVHAEIVSDDGRRFAIFRPANARHRVISVDTARDVSDRFRNSAGEIDVLAQAKLSPRAARQLVCLDAADLRASAETNVYLTRLAACDPDALWAAAEAAIAAEDKLRTVAAETGAQPEDAAIVQSVEDRHSVFVAEQRRAERLRRITFASAAVLALAGLGFGLRGATIATGAALIAAACVAALSLRDNQRLIAAAIAEGEALAVVGAQSYLGFHLHRVDSLLADERQRKLLMDAARAADESHRAFAALVGVDVDASWAIDHRSAVETLRHGSVQVDVDALDASRATLVRARLELLRNPIAGGECLPLVLDDAFRDVERNERPALLELLVERSATQQIVLLTNDEELATWARVESLAGEMAVVEPEASNAIRRSSVSV